MILFRNLLLASFIIYLIASAIFFVVSILRKPGFQSGAKLLFLAAFIIQTAAVVVYSKTAGRLPLTSMHEFILLLSLMIALIFLVNRRKWGQPFLGSVIGPMEVAFLAFLIISNYQVQPLMPALQSIWLHIHVALAIVAYGLFAISFAAGLTYLLSGQIASVEENRGLLEIIIDRSILWGFPFQTLVLITGAVWAEQAWGTWWNWDPKETWALVTWLVYALYLHARSTKEWNGMWAAILAVVGFCVVLFTLFGVTLLLPGLHSYT